MRKRSESVPEDLPPLFPISANEIARMAGVGASAVWNWKKRYDDFPNPVPAPGKRLRYNRHEVLAWFEEKGIQFEIGDTGQGQLSLWLGPIASRNWSISIFQSLVIAGLTFSEHVKNQDKQVLVALEGLRQNLAKELPTLSLSEEMCRHVEQASEILTFSYESYEAVADTLVEALRAEATGHQEQYLEEETLSKCMAYLMKPRNGDYLSENLEKSQKNPVLFDPCSGTGQSLLKVAEACESNVVVGQEVNQAVADFSTLILSLKGYEAEIAIGDSIQESLWPDLKADIVVANPPFGAPISRALSNDVRWFLGKPGRNGINAWIQIVLNHLEEYGRAVVVVDGGWAFRHDTQDIRASLIKQNYLDAVIALPGGALPGTRISALLLLLSKDRESRKHPRSPGEILMIDSHNELESAWSGISDFGSEIYVQWRDHNVDLQGTYVGIKDMDPAEASLRGAFGRGLSNLTNPVVLKIPEQIPENHNRAEFMTQRRTSRFAKETTYADLADNEFNLTPRRYSEFYLGPTDRESLGEVLERVEEIVDEGEEVLERAKHSLRELRPSLNDDQFSDAKLSIINLPLKVLCDTGKLTLIRPIKRVTKTSSEEVSLSSGKRRGASEIDNLDDFDHVFAIDEKWIREAVNGYKTLPNLLESEGIRELSSESILEVGDVVFSMRNANSYRIEAFTITRPEAGSVLEGDLCAIRVTDETFGLSPESICLWLDTADYFQQFHRLANGTHVRRIAFSDVFNLRVPVPLNKNTKNWYEKIAQFKKTRLEIKKELNTILDFSISDGYLRLADTSINEEDNSNFQESGKSAEELLRTDMTEEEYRRFFPDLSEGSHE